MLKIGLTGGIASGKTRISTLFSQQQVPIIDTDVISREILEPGEAAYWQIKQHFGETILLDDGLDNGQDDRQIDRLKLRQLIFNDNTEKVWLESILHPIIFQRTRQKIEQYDQASYVIVVIPLLFEANFRALIDRILVVDCAAEVQIKRLVERDNIDATLAQKMLDQQWSNQARLSLADDIIHNSSNLSLDHQVTYLHEKYKTRSE